MTIHSVTRFALGAAMSCTLVSPTIARAQEDAGEAAALEAPPVDAGTSLDAPVEAEPLPPAPAPEPPPLAQPALPAPAEAPPARPALGSERRPQRVVGFGTSSGAGYAGGYAAGIGGFDSFALELPTFEALIYFDEHSSIDIAIPIVNIALVSAFLGAPVISAMAYADFSAGGDDARFLIGPGLGFSFASIRGTTVGSVRLAALIGAEFLTGGRAFGFRLMTRPFFDIAGGNGAVALGGGALVELGFNFYATR